MRFGRKFEYQTEGSRLHAQALSELLWSVLVDKGCAISHRLKWGPLPPNEVGSIAQHVRNGEGTC